MAGFVEGVDRGQSTLFPAVLDDYVAEDNPVRAVDVFVDGLDLDKLGFVGVQPLDTGRPGYHPDTMLKRRIEVQGGQCARQELHRGQNEAAA
jgi:transposase